MTNLNKARAGNAALLDAASWAACWGRFTLHVLIPGGNKTERRMVLVVWLVMPLVLAGCLLPPPGPHELGINVVDAVAIMALHPILYALVSRMRVRHNALEGWRDALLTATDVTVATLVFYVTVARPGYAQVLLYCTVALAATRYAPRRAFGITSLIALLLMFAALLPLRAALPTVASEIIVLYALTYLVGSLSQAEKAVTLAAAENARLAQTVLRRNRELGALNGLGRTLNAQSDPHDVLALGLTGIAEALDVTNERAYAPSDQGPLRLVSATAGDGANEVAEGRRRNEAARAVAAGYTVVKGWRGPEGATYATPGPLCVSVPLMVRGVVAAVIQADVPPGVPSATRATLETLEIFCDEIAVALENVRLRGDAHQAAILQEKNRIARELHDTVLQMLFGIGLRLQWSIDQLAVAGPMRDSLTEARRLTARAGSELRNAIFTLHSDIAEIGLAAAVRRVVADQTDKAMWSANVMVSGDEPELPLLVQNAAHRVVREALMNAYKHAQATEVAVSLRFTATAVTVVVQDNGVGISERALETFRQMPDHFGLRTVAEQVEGLGGHLNVYNNDDDRGAAVRAIIPLVGDAIQAA